MADGYGYDVAGMGFLLSNEFRGMTAEAIYARLQCGPDSSAEDDAEQHFDDLLEAPVADPAEERSLEEKWKTRIAAAATCARQMGKMPRGFEDLLDQFLAPKENPAERLLNLLTTAVKTRTTQLPPSRRYMAYGLLLPSQKRIGGHVVLPLDTSGSMTNEDLQACLGWVQSALDSLDGLTVTILQVDAKVHSVQTFEHGDSLLGDGFRITGRGGTSFEPAFEWVQEKRESEGMQVDALAYLTDMMGTFPEEVPDYPVLWVTKSKTKVPFGDAVRMES